MDGGLLEPVRGQSRGCDVVELHEQVGVDHGAARQVAAGEVDPALGHLEPAVAECGLLAEPSPGAGHAMAPAPLPQVVEVELEDVVPLDHVGILLGQRGVELIEQRLLGGMAHLLEQEEPLAAAETQADGEHAVPGLPLGC